MDAVVERRRKGSGQLAAKSCPSCEASVTIDPRLVEVTRRFPAQVCPHCRGLVPVRLSDMERLPPVVSVFGVDRLPAARHDSACHRRRSVRVRLISGSVRTRFRVFRATTWIACRVGRAVNSLLAGRPRPHQTADDATERAAVNNWMSQVVAGTENLDAD
jgi:hypothetical protein